MIDEETPGGAMQLVGWLLAFAGIGLMGWGWLYDATITSSPELYGLGDRTFNLGLIVEKLGILITGAGVFAGGCALIAGAAAISALSHRAATPEQT